jgi:TIR domain
MGEESPKPASTPTGAVFLSHASRDGEAAKRICDALRAAGIEVWFNQSELRGGDAWDPKIREQIHACAIFVSIASAHSQSRLDGHFRRECKLAADRTQDTCA